MNFGNRPPHVIQEKTVWAVDRKVEVKYHTYTDVGIRDFARALLRQKLTQHHEKVQYADNLREIAARNGKAGQGQPDSRRRQRISRRQARLHSGHRIGRHAVRRLDIRVPHNNGYFAQGFYASMGFAVPAALGAQIGSGLRPLVMCGDGGFR